MNAVDIVSAAPAGWLRDSVLAPYVPAYVDYLTTRQYSKSTTRNYLCCVAHFAHWSHGRPIELGKLQAFLKTFMRSHLPRCNCSPRPQACLHQVRAALNHLPEVLASQGIVASVDTGGPHDSVLRRFDEHMKKVRGLAASTRLRRISIVSALIHHTSSTTPTAPQLRRFIAHELDRVSPASGGSMAVALRSYLRFRAFEGEHVEHLLPAIVSPANWRLAPLPATLTTSDLNRLLGAFPPGLPSRLRGYAVVRCLVDLGLRSSEVACIELGDIDWAAGTLRINRGKSRRSDVLPLPAETGSAIAEYLRSERPATSNRRIFVRHVAPVDKPIRTDAIRNIVRQAYLRANLPHTRVHILRHTLAGRLLETDGTLKEVADLLRHRNLDTSMIYAKVDKPRLAAVAMPWPGGKS